MIETLEAAQAIWRWPHFKPDELKCHCCGKLRIEESFLDRLERVRYRCGFPFVITSAYRCPEWDAEVAGLKQPFARAPHPSGKAADVLCFGHGAVLIEVNARAEGMTGIGWLQRQDVPHGGRYVHMDDMPAGDPEIPRPWLWTY